MMVSWAGPHSGLVIGGLVGIFLTAVTGFAATELVEVSANPVTALLTSFIFQIGFIAYLSAFINVNPLLELDGYFILMDWLDIPGLRQRAFGFWRQEVWAKWQILQHPRAFWARLSRNKRIFMAYGALAAIYSLYALYFALYFWHSRLTPLIGALWHDYGWWGRALLLVVVTAVVIPAAYYLSHYGLSRIQAGLKWLARRDLLVRVDVLALVVGVPLLLGIPALLVTLWLMPLPYRDLQINIVIWLVFLATFAAMVGIARQLPGSRFQWSVWSLAIAFAAIGVAWLSRNPLPLLQELSLMVAAGSVLAAGIIAWLTLQPDHLDTRERLLMAAFFLLGTLMLVATMVVGNGRWLSNLFILASLISGLIFFAPLLVNFWHSRFALPWMLLVFAVLLIPWLQFFPLFYVLVAILWLYAATLYGLLGTLARFGRSEPLPETEASFSERERLVDAFNHFMIALFFSYEAIFGRRRLQTIQNEIRALGLIDAQDDILAVARQCRRGLLHAVDRLDDLAGTPFTRQAGQAAYDSLSWLEAETLGRQVLAELDWGAQLAKGFIQARDVRQDLIRQADIFAGFDQKGIDELLVVARTWHGRSRLTVARAGEDAVAFYLIESGTVAVFREGQQVATIEAGGYLGTLALRGEGRYSSTYKTLTPVKALVIDRQRFNPLLRADTALSSQVSAGAKSRHLLMNMPLFGSLSPQQLALIDARLRSQQVKAGEIVVRLGDPRSDLFIVANGRLEVLNEADQPIGTLSTGEHFGEYALFADEAYSATLRATVDSDLLLLDEATFDTLVAEYERMSHYVEQIGSGRLLATRRKHGLGGVIS